MSPKSPFHAGEQAAQARFGLSERLAVTGSRMIRDFMPDEHRELFEDLPFVVAGSADHEGRIWASLLTGAPGFVRSPSPNSLRITALPLPGDPLAESLVEGKPMGLLGIELPTRRRNRANGHVKAASDGTFEVTVQQSFGNCPKYIQARAGVFSGPELVSAPSDESAALSPTARGLLERTDTTFIATSSSHPEQGGAQGLDVSHRGGRPGFLRVDGALVTMPDYSGNFLFNTFGNLELNPRAGLLALDFESGDLLSLTGTARVLWDSPEIAAFKSAERLVEYHVERGMLWRAVARDWSRPELSPHLRDK
jgi:uncharacterized protein